MPEGVSPTESRREWRVSTENTPRGIPWFPSSHPCKGPCGEQPGMPEGNARRNPVPDEPGNAQAQPSTIPPLNALQANTLIINYISKRTQLNFNRFKLAST